MIKGGPTLNVCISADFRDQKAACRFKAIEQEARSRD